VSSLAYHDSLGPALTKLKETLSTRKLSGTEEPVDAVVALLLHEHGSDLDLLLIHRAERITDPWSGQIGLPGGRVERTDLSPRAALKREVREEIGLDLNNDGTELGTLSVGSPMRQLDMKVQPWVFALAGRPEIKISPEVQESFWVQVSRLPSLRTSTEIEIRGTRREVDAFLVDRRVVWGYTHRVLSELLSILNPAN
jgi:8-oxo-dGTP pyrophosphatase MutT (NUDIX family)